jgi:GT2 family glycosyltransferase
VNADTRRGAEAWARPAGPSETVLDVAIPTCDRPAELAVTLAGLAAQDGPAFSVTISDQSEVPAVASPSVRAMLRVLEAQGRPVRRHRHLPRRGTAEHRAHLVEATSAPELLLLDDDVWLEPGALAVLHEALGALGCGFVGMAVQGLSYLDDRRPEEQRDLEWWEGPVVPERIRRGAPGFARWRLHNAANLAHIAADHGIPAGGWRPYRVAWIGGCVLYRRTALLEAGGFDFWREVPPDAVGEDVAAEWRVMERSGGAGILPSRAVHLEAPTTLPQRGPDAWDLVLAD